MGVLLSVVSNLAISAEVWKAAIDSTVDMRYCPNPTLRAPLPRDPRDRCVFRVDLAEGRAERLCDPCIDG